MLVVSSCAAVMSGQAQSVPSCMNASTASHFPLYPSRLCCKLLPLDHHGTVPVYT